MKTALVGQYPDGTYEKLCEALAGMGTEVVQVVDEKAYEQLRDAQIIVLRIMKAPREVMERNPDLKMIIRWGAGYDSVDIEAAGERGIAVANTPGANAGAVAQLAVMMMLVAGRKLYSHRDSLAAGHWSKNTFLNSSVTLTGKTVGILGGGNIGRRVSRMVQALGARTQYFDIYRLPEALEQEYQMTYVDFATLLSTSDVLTIHIPLTENNRHIIGKNSIAQMKQGAILINVARGGLVDEEALICAIREKRLRGAGLDCVEHEPLSPEDPLLHEENVIVTPHIGGGTADLGDVILPMIIENIEALCYGRQLKYVVNEKYLKIAN